MPRWFLLSLMFLVIVMVAIILIPIHNGAVAMLLGFGAVILAYLAAGED